MTRLILTAESSTAGALMGVRPGDLAIAVERRLVWGALPSEAQLGAFFAARTTQANGLHWQDDSPSWRLEEFGVANLGLTELCAKCEAVELWINPESNAQLMLLWLLDYLRPHANVTSRLRLVQTDFSIGGQLPTEVVTLRPQAVPIRNDHLEAAGAAWAAWRAPTPEAWFDLLARDVSALPYLRNTVVSLLEELPMRDSGLGATENADAGAGIGRSRAPLRSISGGQETQCASGFRLLGSWRFAGRIGPLSSACCVGTRRSTFHAGDAQRRCASPALQAEQAVAHPAR